MKLFNNFLKVLLIASLVMGAAVAAGAGPYPEKPIEFVTHSAPAGGSDIFARRVADLVGQQKIVPVPLVVVNKSGGSGAVATAYVATKKGDPYTIFATSAAIWTTLLKGEVPVSLGDFTPICGLTQDPNVLFVKADSPYKNMKEFIAAAKKKRKGISLGLTSFGGSDHLVAHRLMKATGAEFNIVSFKQGTEANMALLGGHVDFGLSGPSETAGQIASGQLRVLATATDKRLPYLPNVPTLKEEGIDVSFVQIRGIWGTKDMSKDVVQYLETAFNKITKTEPWNKYIENEMVMNAFIGSADYGKFLEREMKVLAQDMNELGLVKKK
jgi:putative tricarboxylic transport membrane protein